ncbi:MAG TPA: cation transporter dimerization domain-containing protein, partial [Gaiellaceae bacterium]|nr:cation transporter dimerization domain-containing protein [Gaiellaceae bacterium]
ELSLHLKLPGDLSLEEAHAVAEEVEHAIRRDVPEVASVQTHLEPLAEAAEGTRPAAVDVAGDRVAVERIVQRATGREPVELRFLDTDEGLVVYLTLRVDGATPLADAHAEASRVEELIRLERPDISDVIVHTEP